VKRLTDQRRSLTESRWGDVESLFTTFVREGLVVSVSLRAVRRCYRRYDDEKIEDFLKSRWLYTVRDEVVTTNQLSEKPLIRRMINEMKEDYRFAMSRDVVSRALNDRTLMETAVKPFHLDATLVYGG
jgi:hypothetical protein